jgi:hypothetical protein
MLDSTAMNVEQINNNNNNDDNDDNNNTKQLVRTILGIKF